VIFGVTVPALAQLDDLGLEFRSERPARPGLLPPCALHGRTYFLGRTPDDGCPSERFGPNLDYGRMPDPAPFPQDAECVLTLPYAAVYLRVQFTGQKRGKGLSDGAYVAAGAGGFHG